MLVNTVKVSAGHDVKIARSFLNGLVMVTEVFESVKSLQKSQFPVHFLNALYFACPKPIACSPPSRLEEGSLPPKALRKEAYDECKGKDEVPC